MLLEITCPIDYSSNYLDRVCHLGFGLHSGVQCIIDKLGHTIEGSSGLNHGAHLVRSLTFSAERMNQGWIRVFGRKVDIERLLRESGFAALL